MTKKPIEKVFKETTEQYLKRIDREAQEVQDRENLKQKQLKLQPMDAGIE